MAIHPTFETLRLEAGAYRVLPSERGWNLWRFRDWSRRDGGWRIVAELRTREDAWLHALSRLGLMSDPPPAQLPAPSPSVVWTDPEWF